MKKITFLFITFLFTAAAFSQDVIFTKSGLSINCEILKEDSTNVYFVFEKDGEFMETFLNKDNIQSYQYNAVNNNEQGSNSGIINDYELEEKHEFALTVGVLQGGGGLLGVDIELFPGKRIGLQGGAGIGSFGFGLNYHIKPTIRSSFFSLQYWSQTGYATYLGPAYVYRGKRWFTAQIGLAGILSRTSLFREVNEDIDAIVIYSIGAYFPL